ncbi:MAG: aldolase [Clostridiales bacterium]|nr:aldolase [Clostridiales bacterium]
MKYIIDSANNDEILDALSLGACGVTANPAMYLKNHQEFYSFLRNHASMNLPFLSGEVMGETLEEMREEVQKIHDIHPDIVIKLNFSPNALRLCRELTEQGIRTAVTLIFTVAQAVAAINAGADYLFPFIGRSDEYGLDGMALVTSVQDLVTQKNYPVSVVAASIKNLHQLEELAKAGLDYAAIPYALYMKSLEHPLTEKNAQGFAKDWAECERA